MQLLIILMSKFVYKLWLIVQFSDNSEQTDVFFKSLLMNMLNYVFVASVSI